MCSSAQQQPKKGLATGAAPGQVQERARLLLLLLAGARRRHLSTHLLMRSGSWMPLGTLVE
jgi:hypothetical protein